MKDYKSDAGVALSRFAKDKRLRRNDAEHTEHRRNRISDDAAQQHRRSYNPNFTADNRLKGDDTKTRSFGNGDRKPAGEHKTFGNHKGSHKSCVTCRSR